MTKSALVETALNRLLDSDDADNTPMLTDRITDLSNQIGQLDRDLGIVSEIVSLHARFHLTTVVPGLPAATEHRVCERGSARFDESATQVERRTQRGTSHMQEAIDRLGPARSSAASAKDTGQRGSRAATANEPDFDVPNRLDELPEHTAAVREDGSAGDFPVRPRNPLH